MAPYPSEHFTPTTTLIQTHTLGPDFAFFLSKERKFDRVATVVKLSTFRMDCSLDDYVKQNKIGKRGGAAGKAFYNKGQGKLGLIDQH